MVINSRKIYTSVIFALVGPHTLSAMGDLPLDLHRRLCFEVTQDQALIGLYCDSVMNVRQVSKYWNRLLHPSNYDHLHAYSGKHFSVGMKGNLIRQACQCKLYDRARLLFALLRPQDDMHIPCKLAMSKFDTSLAHYVATHYVGRLNIEDRTLLHYLAGNSNAIITRHGLTPNKPVALEEEGKLIRIAMRGGNTRLAQRLFAQLYILGVGVSRSSTFLPDTARAAIRWNNKEVLEDVLWSMKEERYAQDIPNYNKVWSALELARQGASCSDDHQEQMRKKLYQLLIEKNDARHWLYITQVLAKQSQDRAFIWCVDAWREAGHKIDYIKLCAHAAYMGKRAVQEVVDRYKISLDNQHLEGTFRVAMSRGDEVLLAYLYRQLWSPKALWLTEAAQRGYYCVVKNNREGSRREDDEIFRLACHSGHQEIAHYIAMNNQHTDYKSVLHKVINNSVDSDMITILCVLMAKQSCALVCEIIDLIYSRNDHKRNNHDMVQLMRLLVQHDIRMNWKLVSDNYNVDKYREQYEQMRAEKGRSKKEHRE